MYTGISHFGHYEWSYFEYSCIYIFVDISSRFSLIVRFLGQWLDVYLYLVGISRVFFCVYAILVFPPAIYEF